MRLGERLKHTFREFARPLSEKLRFENNLGVVVADHIDLRRTTRHLWLLPINKVNKDTLDLEYDPRKIKHYASPIDILDYMANGLKEYEPGTILYGLSQADEEKLKNVGIDPETVSNEFHHWLENFQGRLILKAY